MALTKTWSVRNLESDKSDGYVARVWWSLTGTENGKTVVTNGKTGLERPDTLVPYKDLTEEIVIGWVKAKINSEAAAVIDELTGKTAVQRTEDNLDKKMAALNKPALISENPFKGGA